MLPEPEALPEILSQLAAEGHVDSTGSFTLDASKVASRYLGFVEDEPAYPVMALLQLGWQLGGRRFEIRLRWDRVVVDIPLKTIDPSFLTALEQLGRGAVGLLASRYHGLGRAVWSGLSQQPQALSLVAGDRTGGLALRYADQKLTSEVLPPRDEPGLLWEMTLPSSWLKWARWAVRHRLCWIESLARRVALFPGSLIMDADDWTYDGDTAITGPWVPNNPGPPLAPVDMVAARLCSGGEYFALLPPYCYSPARVVWAGGLDLTMAPSGPQYFLEGPPLLADPSGSKPHFVREAVKDSESLASRIAHFNHAGQICLIKAREAARLENAHGLTVPPRRFTTGRSQERKTFMSVPMRANLAVWKMSKSEESRIYFVSQGMLLNPLVASSLPRGLLVAITFPAQGPMLDLSGWKVVASEDLLADVADQVKGLLTRTGAGLV